MQWDVMCDIMTWVFVTSGACFCVAGGWGVARFPDFFTRLHGGGVTETLGTGLVLFGLMWQTGWSLATAKLLMICAFLLITSPTACHALAQAALSDGVEPYRRDSSGRGGDGA